MSPDGTPTGEGSEPSNSAHVLLLMASGGDRSILEEWLDRQYGVTVASETAALDQAFDLCVIDEKMFARHHEALVQRKRHASPTFLPYLLVLDGRDAAPDEPRLWQHVDEVLRTPTRKAELQSRLAGLLSRRELSKALAEQQERYRRILQTIPDPVFVLDDGRLVECNPAFEEYMRHDGESITNAALETIPAFPEETVEALSQLAAAMQGDGMAERSGSEAASITYRRPDGTERIAEVAVAPLRTVPDGSSGALFVFRDVTERQDREQALERERERLGDFASMLAHEVRNPLNVAQGYLELVTPDSEQEQMALDRVVAAQARMEQMIKELLAHARGGAVESLQPVSLRAAAEAAWGTIRASEATLELDVEDETVMADAENLQTVLENLFRNVVIHAGAESTVRVGPLEMGGFYVEDDGPGIPPEDRTKVFDRGFTTSAAGSGLGLTLVKQMADAHGWDVRLTESSDGGARFEFAVPDESDVRDEASAD